MAKIIINTTEEEQQKVIKILKSIEGTKTAVSEIAKLVHIPQNRVRYIIDDLLTLNKIERKVEVDFGPRYRRYSYKVL